MMPPIPGISNSGSMPVDFGTQASSAQGTNNAGQSVGAINMGGGSSIPSWVWAVGAVVAVVGVVLVLKK